MIDRTAPFSVTLKARDPDFKVAPLVDAEYLRNGTRYSYNKILVGNIQCHTQGCYFE